MLLCQSFPIIGVGSFLLSSVKQEYVCVHVLKKTHSTLYCIALLALSHCPHKFPFMNKVKDNTEKSISGFSYNPQKLEYPKSL